MPGRLKERERYGVGDKNNKDEKAVNGTQIFQLGSFHWKNGNTFSEILFVPENFKWNEAKSHLLFTSQLEFPEFFGKWKTTLIP